MFYIFYKAIEAIYDGNKFVVSFPPNKSKIIEMKGVNKLQILTENTYQIINIKDILEVNIEIENNKKNKTKEIVTINAEIIGFCKVNDIVCAKVLFNKPIIYFNNSKDAIIPLSSFKF